MLVFLFRYSASNYRFALGSSMRPALWLKIDLQRLMAVDLCRNLIRDLHDRMTRRHGRMVA